MLDQRQSVIIGAGAQSLLEVQTNNIPLSGDHDRLSAVSELQIHVAITSVLTRITEGNKPRHLLKRSNIIK